MTERFLTIGMAGHIDHGKTSLTKALTNIDTDRLKEEKERNISIELGYAPFKLNEDFEVSIIDVPGHERFIRQMVAGVAGIDLVMLVVAADEGIMPQTKEHLEILSFLGIKYGIIVITKIDRAEEELIEMVKEEIEGEIKGTFFEGSPMVCVDSLSEKGIPMLKTMIKEQLSKIPGRNTKGSFRLPIDQVFTVHGKGTVVRGTVYEGTVREGDVLRVLPSNVNVRARQLQVHHERKQVGKAGQRLAINLAGISKVDLKRGNVLVSTTQQYMSTETIDIAFETVKNLKFRLKQRSLVKVHIGTAEVFGNIVFFDRNHIEEHDTVLCQIRLHKPIVTKRGDRFILRRPTPVETIGGGVVIDPCGKRYRFGKETIKMLARKKDGTPTERVIDILREEKLISKQHLLKHAALPEDTVLEVMKELRKNGSIIKIEAHQYVLQEHYDQVLKIIVQELSETHEKFPMREGKSKAEVIQLLQSLYPKKLVETVIENSIQKDILTKRGQLIALPSFEPRFPKQWEKRMEQVTLELLSQGLQVESWDSLISKSQIPMTLKEEFKYLLLRKGIIYALDDKHVIHEKVLQENVVKLIDRTNDSFSLKEGKEILQVSRKYLVLFFELLDHLQITEREESIRKWKKNDQDILPKLTHG